jgi:hypothetical protein
MHTDAPALVLKPMPAVTVRGASLAPSVRGPRRCYAAFPPRMMFRLIPPLPTPLMFLHRTNGSCARRSVHLLDVPFCFAAPATNVAPALTVSAHVLRCAR